MLPVLGGQGVEATRIENRVGEPAENPYLYFAFQIQPYLKEGLGGAFVDYYCRIAESEIARFNLEVSEW